MMDTLLRLTPLTVPSTHWIASNGLCSISAFDTLIGPVTAPWLPSNHSAPTPNCQFGSRLPSRIMVLLEIVVRPSGVEVNRWPTWMPPPWVMPESTTRLPVTVLLLPPYTAMPLASIGYCTVLFEIISPESAPMLES